MLYSNLLVSKLGVDAVASLSLGLLSPLAIPTHNTGCIKISFLVEVNTAYLHTQRWIGE